MKAKIKSKLIELAKKHLGLVDKPQGCENYDPLCVEFGQVDGVIEGAGIEPQAGTDAIGAWLENEGVTVKTYTKPVKLRFVALGDKRASATYKHTLVIQFETEFED